MVICDDNDSVRTGIRHILDNEDDIEVVGEASDRASALAAVADHSPAVAVVDARMRGSSGIDACREIRTRYPDTRVLMLTSLAEEGPVADSIRAGASGYVVKQLSGDGLARGVREVAAGKTFP